MLTVNETRTSRTAAQLKTSATRMKTLSRPLSGHSLSGSLFSSRNIGRGAIATGILTATNVLAQNAESSGAFVIDNPVLTFGIAATLTAAGVFSLAMSVRKNISLAKELAAKKVAMTQAVKQKDASIGNLDGQVKQLTSVNTQLTAGLAAVNGLADTYRTAVLSMTEGDKKTFVRLLTSRVILAEKPEGLAKLLAPFPQETAQHILTASASDPKAFQNLSAAVAVMSETGQSSVAAWLYMLSNGNDKIINDVWASKDGKRAPAIMTLAAPLVIHERTEATLLAAALKSSFISIRTAVVKHAKTPAPALLDCLVGDADESVATEAMKRVLVTGIDTPTLTRALSSKWPKIQLEAARFVPTTERKILTNLALFKDKNISTVAFSKMMLGLTGPEADVIAASSTDADILWSIAGFAKASAASVARSLSVSMVGTKVVDVAEEGGWKDANDEYAPHDWEVYKEEVSHLEYTDADKKKATELLISRPAAFVQETLKLITGDLNKALSGTYHLARVNEVKRSVADANPTQNNLTLAANFIATLPTEEAVKVLMELGAAKTNMILKSTGIPQGTSGAIVRAMPQAFIGEVLASTR